SSETLFQFLESFAQAFFVRLAHRGEWQPAIGRHCSPPAQDGFRRNRIGLEKDVFKEWIELLVNSGGFLRPTFERQVDRPRNLPGEKIGNNANHTDRADGKERQSQ